MPKPKSLVVWIFWKSSVSSKPAPWLISKSKNLKKATLMMKTSYLKKSPMSQQQQKVCVFGSVQSKPCSGSKRKSNPKRSNSKVPKNLSKLSKVSWPSNKKPWSKSKTKSHRYKETTKTHWENHNPCNNKKKSLQSNWSERKSWSEVWQDKQKDGKSM